MRNFELGFVLRSAGSDCSNNGPTSKYDFLYVFRESVSKEQIREWLKEKSAKNTGDRFDALEDKCVYLKNPIIMYGQKWCLNALIMKVIIVLVEIIFVLVTLHLLIWWGTRTLSVYMIDLNHGLNITH